MPVKRGAWPVIAVALTGIGLLCAASPASAEYIVFRSGSRLNVTGWELIGDHYRLQIKGGTVEVPASEVASIEPEDTFDPLPPPLTPKTPFYDLIHAASERYSVDPDLIHCVIAVESNFNPKAISRHNARGLMQLLPQTASLMGVHNVFDPAQNIDGGTHYLKAMLTRYGNNVNLALAAYNAGPLRVDQYGHRVPPYRETTEYIQRVARTYAKVKAQGQQGDSAAAASASTASQTAAPSN
jgi:soluble lytic murein transglycosylase-like protein